jgi:hypothetical protein
MERNEIIKLILDNDGSWVNKHLNGFTPEKIIEFSNYVSDVIKGKREKPASISYLTSNFLSF